MKAEHNELLTRTGPGTPMGELFRRYWLPVLLSWELPAPDSPPVRVKCLGERMGAFCDSEGRLAVAKALGADHVIDVQKEDPLARIMEVTGGKGVDVVLDCTAGAGTLPVLLGIEALKRKAGTMVVQGEMADFPDFPIGRMTTKAITIKIARGHSYKACELALQQLASKRFPLE